MSLSHIFLFGHRKTAGKDASIDILKSILKYKNITFQHAYFAKLLKKHVSERYGLDFSLMCDDNYKNSKPKHLNGASVRDILIKEGCAARAIWEDVWAFPVYNELLNSNCEIGLVSDFRYPNEYSCFNECFDIVNKNNILNKPKIIKVLIHRPNGEFVSDGADDQLPDIDPYWDHMIINDDVTINWQENIKKQLNNMLKLITGI